jgi:antitoxin component YwqK of YwqJK toxin-antitoxin module
MPKNQPVNIEDLNRRSGIYYEKNSEEPYNGPLLSTPTFDRKTYEGSLKDGLFNGVYSEFTLDQQKVLEANFKEGQQDGLVSRWFKTGKKLSEANYSGGEKHGSSITWFENEKKRFESSWKHGKADGLSQDWHGNGQLKFEETFVDGKNVGISTGWYDNGQKKELLEYKDGHQIKKQLWHADGTQLGKTSSAHYLDGKLAVNFHGNRADLEEHGIRNIKQLIDDKIVTINITDHSPDTENKIINFFNSETAIDYVQQVIRDNPHVLSLVTSFDEEKHNEFVAQIDARYPNN